MDHSLLLSSSPEQYAEWDSLVTNSSAPDTYYRPSYVSAYAGSDSTSVAIVLRAGDRRFLLPVLIRSLPALPVTAGRNWCDAITPYGYGGLLPLEGSTALREDEAIALVQALKSWCLDNGVLSCLVRLHPLLGEQIPRDTPLAESMGARLRRHGPTQAIDLAQWNCTLDAPAGLNTNRRRDLKKARQSLSVRLACGDSTEAIKLLPTFQAIYEETMHRVHASSYYFFSRQHLRMLLQNLGRNVAIAIAYRGETPVSGSLFFADNLFGHYHLGGTNAEGLHYGAPTLVQVAGAAWARSRGCRWYHLGGARATADPLHQFKQSFGTVSCSYSYLTHIADPVRYRQMEQLRNLQQAPSSDDHYFPSYRRSSAWNTHAASSLGAGDSGTAP